MAPSGSEDVLRPLTSFPQGIWDDRFLESDFDSSQMEAYAKEIDILKEQVRAMLIDESINHKHKLDWINVVDRLGISYYFEKEIEDQLECIFKAYDYDHNYDLYTISTHFRVFRQHGHKMSCDVFNKFKNGDGWIQDGLKSDVKGILSLYEAAHLGVHDEEFMDEALDQTLDILRSIVDSEPNLEDECLYNQVVHATEQPFHTGMKRVETRHFISFYEKDESRNDTFLRLAKLGFNILQELHRQELCQIVKWWNELDVKTQLSYARNRSVESHFWAVGMYFEPCYSRTRIFVAKVINIISTMDDTYDSYGTIEELRLLTKAFERWDKEEIIELPGKMKLLYNYVFNVIDEFDKDMAKEGRSYAGRYAKASVLDLIRAYYVEASWAHRRYTPSYEEYMSKAARTTSASKIIITVSMLGMKAEIVNEKGFEWVTNLVSRAIRGSEDTGRLLNDIASHQDEQKRSFHVASAVECYIKEHGTNEDEAVTKLMNKVRVAWKDINEDLVAPIDVSQFKHLVFLPLNFGRANHGHYKKGVDGYTKSAQVLKNDFGLVYAKTFNI